MYIEHAKIYIYVAIIYCLKELNVYLVKKIKTYIALACVKVVLIWNKHNNTKNPYIILHVLAKEREKNEEETK